MMLSAWSANSDLPRFQSLHTDTKTDVLIIGGGLVGILCAYMLQEKGIDYVLVEAKQICSGVTKNTTAKLTWQHGLIYDKLIRQFGVEKAGMYLRANEAALEKYRSLCQDLDCDFEGKDAYTYTLKSPEKIEKELLAMSKLGAPAQFSQHLPLPLAVVGAIRFPNQAQFNPLKFVAALAPSLNIYENSKVQELAGTTAFTAKAKIVAQRIIVATHFPFINKHGAYFLKMHQNRSYVIALEKAANVKGMYRDEAKNGLSFRNYGDLLLLGGGAHRTGCRGGKWAELEAFAKRNYPAAIEKYRWATQDCMTLDGLPYIGRYSDSTPRLYVATGFNKWGMTTSMVAAMILSDLVEGKNNDWAPVFLPSRSMMRPQLLLNMGKASCRLLTPTTKRCPHLGCALKWNKEEKTWDCPCHGSRFTEEGQVIDNPATDDLKFK